MAHTFGFVKKLSQEFNLVKNWFDESDENEFLTKISCYTVSFKQLHKALLDGANTTHNTMALNQKASTTHNTMALNQKASTTHNTMALNQKASTTSLFTWQDQLFFEINLTGVQLFLCLCYVAPGSSQITCHRDIRGQKTNYMSSWYPRP